MKKSIFNILSFLVPLMVAVFSGWYWRTPNFKGLAELRIVGNEWQKDLVLEKLRLQHAEIFDNRYFDFNFVAAAVSAIIVYIAFRWYVNKNWLQG